MTLEERIFEAMQDMMVDRYKMDVARVLSYEDTTVSSGGCETCWFEYDVCEITYLDSEGKLQTWNYSGTFGELIFELTTED